MKNPVLTDDRPYVSCGVDEKVTLPGNVAFNQFELINKVSNFFIQKIIANLYSHCLKSVLEMRTFTSIFLDFFKIINFSSSLPPDFLKCSVR
jgi:hypothetical protein